MQHYGSLGLAPVQHGLLFLQQVGHAHVPDLDHAYARFPGEQGGQGIHMRLVAVRRDDHELAHAMLLPGVQQLVQGAVQRLGRERGGAGEGAVGAHVDAIVDGGGPEDVVFPGEVHGDLPRDEHVGAQRQVRAVLLERPDGQQQARIARELCGYVDPAQLVETERLL
jgi:hypothetical protein